MGIFKILVKGVRITNKNFKIIVYLWIVNLIFSFIAIAPLSFLINKNLSRSLMGEKLVESLDFLWVGDIIHEFQNITPALLGGYVVILIFYLLLFVFLNGGIIGRLNAFPEKTNMENFFSDCGLYFWRFFKLFLISILGYIIFIGFLFQTISRFIDIFTKNAKTEWSLIIASNLKNIIFILIFTVVNMFFDYAKIRLVVNNSKKVLIETGFTISFLLKRFFRAWGLYLLIFLIALIFGFIYLEISRIIPSTNFLLVLLVFAWQQVYILSRLWIKLLFFSSQLEFYRTSVGLRGESV